MHTQFFHYGGPDAPVSLRSGESLPGVTLAYETYGKLSSDCSNAILIFHAMTGSQHAAGWNPGVEGIGKRWTEDCKVGWWDGFIGPGRAFDTDKYFVVCANYIGGCYGSTGPASIDPRNGRPFGSRFPSICIPDIVDSQVRLIDHLGVRKLRASAGGSIGGLLALDLAVRYPDRVDLVVPIASGLAVTPLQRILNFEQIMAIESDPDFCNGDYYDEEGPVRGLALARMIAHKTFISLSALELRARQEVVEPSDYKGRYRLTTSHESYMLHQGLKFVDRFDANSYLRIVEAWQRFDLAKISGTPLPQDAFGRCPGVRFLLFSIDSDVCFYPQEQEELAAAIQTHNPHCLRITVHSDKGHDAFLLEPELFAPHIEFALSSSLPE